MSQILGGIWASRYMKLKYPKQDQPKKNYPKTHDNQGVKSERQREFWKQQKKETWDI